MNWKKKGRIEVMYQNKCNRFPTQFTKLMERGKWRNENRRADLTLDVISVLNGAVCHLRVPCEESLPALRIEPYVHCLCGGVELARSFTRSVHAETTLAQTAAPNSPASHSASALLVSLSVYQSPPLSSFLLFPTGSLAPLTQNPTEKTTAGTH